MNWRLGRKREAVAALKAAVATNPNNLEAQVELGSYQVCTGDFQGAVQTIRAIGILSSSEEVREYFADKDRNRHRDIFLLPLGTGLSAMR